MLIFVLEVFLILSVIEKLFFAMLELCEHFVDLSSTDFDDSCLTRMNSCRVFTSFLLQENGLLSKQASIS